MRPLCEEGPVLTSPSLNFCIGKRFALGNCWILLLLGTFAAQFSLSGVFYRRFLPPLFRLSML